MERSDLPRVTPYLLRRAETMCPLRLERDLAGCRGMLSPFLRFRVRDPFLAAARAAHAELAPPRGECFRPPGELRAEERALFERAAGHYLAAFGAVPARAIDHGCDEPTPWPSGGASWAARSTSPWSEPTGGGSSASSSSGAGRRRPTRSTSPTFAWPSSGSPAGPEASSSPSAGPTSPAVSSAPGTSTSSPRCPGCGPGSTSDWR